MFFPHAIFPPIRTLDSSPMISASPQPSIPCESSDNFRQVDNFCHVNSDNFCQLLRGRDEKRGFLGGLGAGTVFAYTIAWGEGCSD